MRSSGLSFTWDYVDSGLIEPTVNTRVRQLRVGQPEVQGSPQFAKICFLNQAPAGGHLVSTITTEVKESRVCFHDHTNPILHHFYFFFVWAEQAYQHVTYWELFQHCWVDVLGQCFAFLWGIPNKQIQNCKTHVVWWKATVKFPLSQDASLTGCAREANLQKLNNQLPWLHSIFIKTWTGLPQLLLPPGPRSWQRQRWS